MYYLSPEQILFIHARLIAETGGEHGIRDLGLLQSAAFRPQATFEGTELYPNIYHKAAALMESLINNHPFIDGNKRTGITSAAMFLLLNGYSLTASNDELESYTFSVASGNEAVELITEWLKQRSQNVKA
ncbi:MAG: type II toxin-antitoxin system death-on-curing family toxin [Anaerolineales bacterium]